MDSQTTTPAAPDPLAAMLQNATIDKAKGNEFTNTAGDMFKFILNNYNFAKEGESLGPESSDPINHLLKAIPHFLAEVRKNDQYRSAVGEIGSSSADISDQKPQTVSTDHSAEGEPVEIIDLVPSETSLMRVASVADRYTRSMLKSLAGYPLYEPQPFSELSTEYLRHGVNVGDVGFVRGDGVFDFLFNVCPTMTNLVNPPNLSDGFSLETVEHSATRAGRALPRKTCLFQTPITRTKSGEYICEGSEGAILELPEGAIQEEATNIRPFEKLAARHGVQWYEYTMARGRKISNGSLYLITSFTKCAQWGIAVFDRPCVPGQGLRFDKKKSLPFSKSASKYHWKGSRAFPTKVSDSNQGNSQNQCVFLRGYKIMIRQDIFDDLCNDQPRGSGRAMTSSSSQAGSISVTRDRATRIRGGGGSDPLSKRLISGGLLSWTTMSTTRKSDEVVLHANFNLSLIHPSDLINAALLSQNRDAKVAVTYDDVWCDLLRGNFPKFNYATLVNAAQSYTRKVDEYDCVTLEKISDSSSSLDESNYPPQGVEISALKPPLTTPDDDNAALHSVTLPRELVEQILLLLDADSMLTCRLVNREFNEAIQSSTLLQYCLACKVAGVVDNPQSRLSYAKRLEALRKREDLWKQLKPMFKMTISVKHQTAFQICRSTEGVYFLSDNDRKGLHYCHLTSFPQDNPRWIGIPGHGPAPDWSGILVNFGTALYEHDLIVNLISPDIENQTDMGQHSLDLVLLKFSTGEYHPLARRPRLHVQRSHEGEPWLHSGIVGDHLALVVSSRDGSFSDKLFIFDWKTGRRLLQHDATENGYSSLVFVSPELLLVANSVLLHFEVWQLPSCQLDPKLPIQILSLKIPTMSPEYFFSFPGDIQFSGSPNPFLHSMSYPPPQPFLSSPVNSILMAKLRMRSNSRGDAIHNLIMHRRALIDMIETWTSPSLLKQQEHLQMWLTNEVTVHQIVDPEDGSIGLDVQSKLVSTKPHPWTSPQTHDSPTFATSQTSRSFPSLDISADSESISSRCTFLQVPWAKWGPSISRWFQVNETQGRWATRSHGQRCAFSDPNPVDTRKLMVSVVDFNPHNSRRNTEMMARVQSMDGKNNGHKDERKEEEQFEILDHKGVFSEKVYMGLKCVVYHAPDEYDFDLVLMDEQRLFGLTLNGEGWIESVKILYIG